MKTWEDVERAIQEYGGDSETTSDILERVNSGTWNEEVADVATLATVTLATVNGNDVVDISTETVQNEERGWQEIPFTALGILNGGSATSYVDRKKNLGIAPGLGVIYEPYITTWSENLSGLPKALAPAFFQPNGEAGADFLELKIRAVLLRARAFGWGQPVLFQMTSPATHRDLLEAIDRLPNSPYISDLLDDNVVFPRILTREQELVGAMTPKNAEGKRSVFFYGDPPQPLLLPGGHGQNFRVLKPVYHQLKGQGFRYAYITNVDNLGALPSPQTLGLLTEKDADAGFDFSFRTAVDVKGGVLFRNSRGKLQCGDIGVAVPASFLEGPNSETILFNCATGVFRLDRLCPKLDDISQNLPLRVSEQDKDIGKYAQAEQVTWEIIGLLEKPIVFAVDKMKRFLAAKMVMESFMTSGLELDHPAYRTPEMASWHRLATNLHSGLVKLLEGPYGLIRDQGRWRPLSGSEVDYRLKKEGKGWLNL